MEVLRLGPVEVEADRPFTDLRHTARDIQVMRFMVVCVWLALEQLDWTESEVRPIVLHQPHSDAWVHRIVITHPQQLIRRTDLVAVGFFGQRAPGGDLTLAQELDRGLIPELMCFDELLCYMSVALPTSDFANLVVFSAAAGKERWGESRKHAEAIRLLTPDYYRSVRLYNGSLPDGMRRADTLRLDLVKYYDYRSQPIWRAIRELAEWNTLGVAGR